MLKPFESSGEPPWRAHRRSRQSQVAYNGVELIVRPGGAIGRAIRVAFSGGAVHFLPFLYEASPGRERLSYLQNRTETTA